MKELNLTSKLSFYARFYDQIQRYGCLLIESVTRSYIFVKLFARACSIWKNFKKNCNHTISSCYRMSRQIRSLTLLDSTILDMKLENAFQLNKRYLWIKWKAQGVYWDQKTFFGIFENIHNLNANMLMSDNKVNISLWIKWIKNLKIHIHTTNCVQADYYSDML